MEARPAVPHTPQRQAACELSRRQAQDGLAMLRDINTEMNWPPLIWTRVDGYQFTVDGDELERYEVAWVRVKVTEVRRFITATPAPERPPRPWRQAGPPHRHPSRLGRGHPRPNRLTSCPAP
ncbi:RacP protein [Streptomyces lasiicapitis]|uniref:RacP protein n=1 Tax=Streptomyces lasiicapitis TaxID=1923961 RepID=UPI00331EF351